ncbi:MAG: ThiF family adenylyltransferase [Micrococcales bacterium]|nr:ThiF family adenylyltransferase [Micrococcales bacterium]
MTLAPPLTAAHPVTAPSFYAQLTERNRGFISDRAQQRLSETVVLVAGCGSTGGAVVEPLARLGVQRFLLADVGHYELNNLNRQNAYVDEIGEHKAVVCARRIAQINPAATAEIREDGITRDNARDLVSRCGVVIDGVDVTEPSGWLAKFVLHKEAARLGRPVVSGYDMAGTQYVRFYDYRPGDAPFHGAVRRADVERAMTWDLLRRVVPMRYVPVEMIDLARARVRTGEDGLPQVVYASLAFGAIASRIVVCLMEGQPVRTHTVVGLDSAVRRPRANAQATARKPLAALLALRDLAAARREARHG